MQPRVRMRSTHFVLIFFALSIGGCTSGLGVPSNNDGSVATTCSEAHDSASCNAIAGCVLDECPCGAERKSTVFVACYPPGTHFDACSSAHPPKCAVDCASAHDADSCAAIPGCTAQICTGGDCNGHTVSTFSSCHASNVQPAMCPGVPECPVSACGSYKTESDCAANSQCHRLYADPGTCDCPYVNCCAVFSACGDGWTTCAPMTTSGEPPPYTCGPHYSYSYDRQGRLDGCTRSNQCPLSD